MARKNENDKNQNFSKKDIETQIDEFLIEVGYKNPAEFTDENGIRFFEKGSAKGLAFVGEFEGQAFLEIRGFVMELPSDKDLLLPLYRELLEINIQMAGAVRLGLDHENVMASLSFPIEYLREGDVGTHMNAVMSFADHIDDMLKEKYGVTSRKR